MRRSGDFSITGRQQLRTSQASGLACGFGYRSAAGVSPAQTIPAKPPAVPRCRDPFDPPFLHLAAHGKADYLVTGDRDLLALRGQLRCAIVTAEAFLSALNLR